MRKVWVVVFASLAIVLSAAKLRAEIVFNFPFPEVVAESGRASAELTRGMAGILLAISFSEVGDRNQTRTSFRQAIGHISAAHEIFMSMKRNIPNRKIDYNLVARRNPRVSVESAFKMYGIGMPADTRELGEIAANVIAGFAKSIGGLNVDSAPEIRLGLLETSDQWKKILDLGPVISMLAEATL